MSRIIDIDRSIVPACDVDWATYARLTFALDKFPKIWAVKIGIALALGKHGLHAAVEQAHHHGLNVIYDHQKAGTDIHESTPQKFMDRMVEAKVDAVILFPLSGPAVQYEWTKAAQERELGVIVGGEMTHPRFLQGDFSNGKKDFQDYSYIFAKLGLGDITGYIRQDAPRDIFSLAAKMGVQDFVVPGNKPERITLYKEIIQSAGVKDPAFFSPGLIAQGGNLSDGAKAAGKCFHGIVGRALYQPDNIKKAAEELTSQI